MEIDPRVHYAAERTLLAWIRTGLALMGFGFVVARFSLFLRDLTRDRADLTSTPGLSLYIGTSLVGIGVLVTLLASFRHRADIKKLRAGKPLFEEHSASAGEVVGFALSIVGIVIALYLLRLQS
jgi:putative membrane protein